MNPGRPTVIAIWAGVLLACGAVILHTRVSTDMSAFLPRAPNPSQQILVDQLREGVVSRLILLAIEGADPNALAALSKTLASDLRSTPGLGVVSNGELRALDHDRDLLWRNRYLLSPDITTDHFTPAALHAALEADVGMLNSDFGILAKRAIPADPTGEMMRLLDNAVQSAHPAELDGVWMASDHSRALLMVQTLAAGFDINRQEQAIQRIETAFVAARRDVPGASKAHLVESGPPVFAVHTRTRLKQDVQRLSSIATILIAAVLLLAYRSARVLLLALLPVLTGVAAGMASVALSFGFVHGITIGFGVTLIGEAVDYAIYLFTQTKPDATPEQTLKRIWPTLRLGLSTSVCGFSAMLFSSFTGFVQLGLFTIVGLLAALAVTRFVLPALLPARARFPGAGGFAAPLLWLMRPVRLARPAVLAISLLAVCVIVFHPGRYWEDELASMSPLSSAEKLLDEQLRGEIGAPDVRYFLVAKASGQDQALAASERIAAHLGPLVADGLIGGFDFPARWLPSQSVQRARQLALPDAEVLRANLAEAIRGTAFREDGFAPFLADVAAAARQKLVRRDDFDGTSLAIRLDSLLVPGPGGWNALLPLRGVSDPKALAAQVSLFGESGLLFLDLKAESDRLLDSYLEEAQTLSLFGGLAVVALLAASLRSVWRVIAVVLPLAASVVSMGAILLAFGGTLSIFNLFGLLLVVAVGSNYCLFFLGLETEHHSRERTVASLVLANLCTVIGFGVLSFSRFPVLHGIGGTVSLGALLCLLFGALLSSPAPRAEAAVLPR